jgi:sigma-B regulation protein RsbU (phosphoserine phosphatase)
MLGFIRRARESTILNKNKILIADDNLDMIYLIKKGFEGQGYEIIEAHDGDEAIKKVINEKPDLVLLDLKMPRRHGLDVLREIRKNEELKDTPVIVLTVVSDTDEKIAALENGANDFLLKPPLTSELRARVNTQLNLRNATQVLIDYTHKLEEAVENKTRELREYANRLEEMVEDKVGVIKHQNEEHLLDIKSAAKIQRSLLPGQMPDLEGVRFVARYVPCERIGGDFYNVFRIDENTVGFFIADVSGHGVPSAMITVFLKQELSYYAKKMLKTGRYSVAKPKEVLHKFNRSFIENKIGEGTYFVTVVYCIFELHKRKLTVSIAGHHALPVIKRNDGRLETIELQGFPIGWFEVDEEYKERRYQLDPGDTLFLYTDGLLDIARGKGRIDFDSVNALIQRDDMEKVLDRMIRSYRKRDEGERDDVTLLAMHVTS